MEFKSREVDRALQKKGFKREDDKSHVYFYHEYRGVETGATTHISHGVSTVAGPLIGLMKRQLKLKSSQQFFDLIKCPMTSAAYNKILEETNVFSSSAVDQQIEQSQEDRK